MQNFPHEMIREMFEQPEALRRTLALYLDGDRLKPEVAQRLAGWPNPAGEVLIAASGSSRHSGLYGEILLEDLCGLAVDVEYASEYSCRGGLDLRHPSVLVLSQSGETSDTMAALTEAHRQSHKTLAITNVPDSTMASEADVSMPLAAGREKAIPATKSFTCQLAVLYLLALYEAVRLGLEHNLDIAIEPARLAVEVIGSRAGEAATRRLRERTEYLLDAGWCVVFVPLRTLPQREDPGLAAIAEHLIALTERVRRDESLRRKYGVIGRDGKPSTYCRRELDGLPRIPGA